MEEIEVLEDLFDKKIISILKVLYRDTEKEHYLQELSVASSVPIATTSRILLKLEKCNILRVKKIARFKLYSLQKNKRVLFLSRLFKEDLKILQRFVTAVRKVDGEQMIILHGKESKDKANILLIGEKINPGEVKRICAEIAEKYKFTVSPLSLTKEQYAQMSQMGLYSGTKRILFERGGANA